MILVVWRADTKRDTQHIEISQWYFRGESSIGYYLHHDWLIIDLEGNFEQCPVLRKILQNLSEIGSWCRHKVEMMNQVSVNLRDRKIINEQNWQSFDIALAVLQGMRGMVH